MCVKFKKNEKLVGYNTQKCLEKQLKNVESVVVNYKKAVDEEVDCFLNEIEKLSKSGSFLNPDIKVVNNNNLPTARARQRIKKAERNFHFNQLVKELSTSQLKNDRKLEELSEMMKDRKHRVKKEA